MKLVSWLMRPIASVEMKDVRNGHHALMTLVCGHVAEMKASRFRTQKPKRVRCDECGEIYQEFMDADRCARVVSNVERGKIHDFAANNRRSGSTVVRGPANSGGRADARSTRFR